MRKMLTRSLALLVIMTLLAGCSGGGKPAEAEKKEATPPAPAIQEMSIDVATSYAEEHIQTMVIKKFKEIVEQKSNGKIKANIFFGGVMGGEKEVSEAISIGTVQIHSSGFWPINMFAPEEYWIDTAYVIRDPEHFKKVWQSSYGDTIRKKMEEKGNTKFFNDVFFYRGWRATTSNKPIQSPSDIKGVKMRVPTLDSFIFVWDAIGANVTPIALNELYTSLATGAVSASEGDAEQLYSYKLHEVQKYISKTNHLLGMGLMSVNAKWYNGLNEPTQKVIKESLLEAAQWADQTAKERESKLIQEMAEKGVTVIEDVDTEAFRKAAMPGLEKLFQKTYTTVKYEDIQNIK